jgi:hypothetical protein
MRPEECSKVVRSNRGGPYCRVSTSPSSCDSAYVPHSDAPSDQVLQTLRVGERRRRAGKLAHDPPEGIARLRIVLTACERRGARERPENEHLRIWPCNWLEAGRFHSEILRPNDQLSRCPRCARSVRRQSSDPSCSALGSPRSSRAETACRPAARRPRGSTGASCPD